MRRRVLMFTFTLVLGLALARMVTLAATDVASAQSGTIYQATLAEPNQKTPEVSTEELRRILADGSAIVLDSRSRAQYVASHIPGARNAAPRPGAPRSEFIAEVGRLVGGDKTKALVLYCNGPFCQASKRLSEDLLAAGFTNVRRYQLGLPVGAHSVGAPKSSWKGSFAFSMSTYGCVCRCSHQGGIRVRKSPGGTERPGWHHPVRGPGPAAKRRL